MLLTLGVLKRCVGSLFVALLTLALFQCAKRGSPSGGPKDSTPPVQVRAEPGAFSTGFSTKKFRIYFDEYIRLENPQDQLIISPPLEQLPLLHPQGSASKYVEVSLQDTLRPNTTYTFNFGQSIVDNNENNPAPFLSYVFSTGDYLDSLTLTTRVVDAFNKNPDEFISIMLYEIDSAYTDSLPFLKAPTYIANTLDSLTTITLQNLKAGAYRLLAVKDEAKNNIFDRAADKIGFVADTIRLPADTTYTLSLFREIRDFDVVQPSLASANRIVFGYYGTGDSIQIRSLTALPDTWKSTVRKEAGKDTLNYWFTPPMPDSLLFEVRNGAEAFVDTFTVKSRNLNLDSLRISPSHSRRIDPEDQFSLQASTPLILTDTSRIKIIDQDSIAIPFQVSLDSLENALAFEFEKEPNNAYTFSILPEAMTDFFGSVNDTLSYTISTGSLADYGNLTLNLSGNMASPILLQLINTKGESQREVYVESPGRVYFNNLEPAQYGVRAILDGNRNRKWDTGSFLDKRQAEKVIYYPRTIDVRANWEIEQDFNLIE